MIFHRLQVLWLNKLHLTEASWEHVILISKNIVATTTSGDLWMPLKTLLFLSCYRYEIVAAHANFLTELAKNLPQNFPISLLVSLF